MKSFLMVVELFGVGKTAMNLPEMQPLVLDITRFLKMVSLCCVIETNVIENCPLLS